MSVIRPLLWRCSCESVHVVKSWSLSSIVNGMLRVHPCVLLTMVCLEKVCYGGGGEGGCLHVGSAQDKPVLSLIIVSVGLSRVEVDTLRPRNKPGTAWLSAWKCAPGCMWGDGDHTETLRRKVDSKSVFWPQVKLQHRAGAIWSICKVPGHSTT